MNSNYRVYYDKDGKILNYTTENLPGTYITVSSEQYAAARYNLIVENGHLKDVDLPQSTRKIMRLRKMSKPLEKEEKIVDSSKYSDTICTYAWNYPIFQLARNEFRWCCRTPPIELDNGSVPGDKDIFTTHPKIVKMRQELLQGIRTEACNECWKLEKENSPSPFRTTPKGTLKYFRSVLWKNLSMNEVDERLRNLDADTFRQLTVFNGVKQLEINLGSVCNLKCIYCNHTYSSQWAVELIKHGELPRNQLLVAPDNKFENLFFDWFYGGPSAEVERINFIGGEPLLIENLYIFIDKFIEHYRTTGKEKKLKTIVVVTNLSTPREKIKRLEEVIKKLQKIDVYLTIRISFESVEKKFEYIRSGADWNLFKENLEYLIEICKKTDAELLKTKIYILPTINLFCLLDLKKWYKFLFDLQVRHKYLLDMNFNLVTDPDWLDPTLAPSEIMHCIIDSVNYVQEQLNLHPYLHSIGWNDHLNHMRTIEKKQQEQIPTEIAKKILYNIDKLDSRRGSNFLDVFPEYTAFINQLRKM